MNPGSIPGPILYTSFGITYGNFEKHLRIAFLRSVQTLFSAKNAENENGDYLLLGLDLVGEEKRMLAAYGSDIAAATRFNLLRVINRELGANFDEGGYKSENKWLRTETEGRIEGFLTSKRAQRVVIPPLGRDISNSQPAEVVLEKGEPVLLAISVKFTREGMETELREAGMQLCGWFTDAEERVALALVKRQH